MTTTKLAEWWETPLPDLIARMEQAHTGDADALAALVEHWQREARFHSRLDRRDTIDGWTSVQRDATHGVPYSALLYQRYVGGQWRQVQDTYSEVKGDEVLEGPPPPPRYVPPSYEVR